MPRSPTKLCPHLSHSNKKRLRVQRARRFQTLPIPPFLKEAARLRAGGFVEKERNPSPCRVLPLGKGGPNYLTVTPPLRRLLQVFSSSLPHPQLSDLPSQP